MTIFSFYNLYYSGVTTCSRRGEATYLRAPSGATEFNQMIYKICCSISINRIPQRTQSFLKSSYCIAGHYSSPEVDSVKPKTCL